LEHFSFLHLLGITIPTDELIFFRGVGWNHQPVAMGVRSSYSQLWLFIYISIFFIAKYDVGVQDLQHDSYIYHLHSGIRHKAISGSTKRWVSHRELGPLGIKRRSFWVMTLWNQRKAKSAAPQEDLRNH
jgi:hypothetical protein